MGQTSQMAEAIRSERHTHSHTFQPAVVVGGGKGTLCSCRQWPPWQCWHTRQPQHSPAESQARQAKQTENLNTYPTPAGTCTRASTLSMATAMC